MARSDYETYTRRDVFSYVFHNFTVSERSSLVLRPNGNVVAVLAGPDGEARLRRLLRVGEFPGDP